MNLIQKFSFWEISTNQHYGWKVGNPDVTSTQKIYFDRFYLFSSSSLPLSPRYSPPLRRAFFLVSPLLQPITIIELRSVILRCKHQRGRHIKYFLTFGKISIVLREFYTGNSVLIYWNLLMEFICICCVLISHSALILTWVKFFCFVFKPFPTAYKRNSNLI